MNIAVIIPVVQTSMAMELLFELKEGAYLPSQVIVIDNSTRGIVSPIHSTQIILPFNRPLTVNASWELGFSHLCSNIDVVAVLNDDIHISKYFLLQAVKLYNDHDSCGIAFPHTVDRPSDCNIALADLTGKVEKTRKRSGWAWFIRRTTLNCIPPIPEELVTFFGDAWYVLHNKLKHWDRYLMLDNPVYHYGGVTLKQGLIPHRKRELYRDRITFRKLKQESVSWPTQLRI